MGGKTILQIIPTGKVMAKRGSCPTPELTRNCGHSTEDVTHIFQCYEGEEIWENPKKVLITWGEQNKAAPNLILSILQGMNLWRRLHL